MAKYSIIVPVYNSEKTIGRCINSIIKQTYKDWECIIINDGSKDKTLERIKKYVGKDERFKIKTIKNSGVSVARNTGIQMATGEYLAFCDADDEYVNTKLEICNKVLTENPEIQILWHGLKVIENKKTKYWHTKIPGTYYCSDPNDKILSNLTYDIGHCHNKIYKKSLIIENNIKFPEKCAFAEDLLFNIQAYVKSGSLTSIPDALYVYYLDRSRHSVMHGGKKLIYIQSFKKIADKLKDDKNFQLHKNKFKSFCDNVIKRHENEKTGVDYVFTYVTMNDPKWVEQYNKYVDKEHINRETNSKERFTAYDDMLRFKFRCIEHNTKKLNGVVHMIVSNKEQIPEWLDTSKVNIVYHEEFIPKELLPTFNSNTIEIFLHDIFGLSEKFLYSNDDFFVLREIKPNELFFERGDKKQIKIHVDISKSQSLTHIYEKGWKNASDLAISNTRLKNSLFKKYLFEVQHVHKPMFRSIYKNLYETHKQILYNSCTRFRNNENIAHYFYYYWMFYNKKTMRPTYTFLCCRFKTFPKMVKRLKNDKRLKFICINDDENTTKKEYDFCLDTLKTQFPYLKNKSIFEKQ